MALQRGTASNVMGEFTSSNTLFRPGIKYITGSDKTSNIRLRLLPDFNESLSHADPAYPTSWVPYRQAGVMNQTTGRDELSGFFIQLRAYRYWGRQQLTFFSPSCRDLDPTASIEDRIDPIAACREVARKDGRWKHLTEKPTGPDSDKLDKAPLAGPSTMAFMNAITWSQSQTGVIMPDTVCNSIVGLSGMGFDLLIKQLDWLTTAEARREQLDPAWPTYLLGDVMAPTWGRIGWFAQQATEGNKSQQIWTVKFTAQDQRLVGDALMPLAPDVANRFLAGRYNLGDTEKVLHVMKPKEVIEMMLADGLLPRDLIAYACSHIADIPGGGGPTFAAASTVHPGMAPGLAHPHGTSSAPPMQAANPFGGQAMPTPVDPFGGAAGAPPMPAPMAANPFGGASGAPQMPAPMAANPFGGAPVSAAPFGSGAPVAANPFGGAPDAPFGGLPPTANPFGGAPSAPPMPAPAPQAAPAEALDWFMWEGDRATGKAVPSTLTQVTAAAAANPRVMICSTAPNAVWKIPSDYGIQIPTTAAPAAPAAPIAPAPAAGAPLTAEERTEMNELIARSQTSQLELPMLHRLISLQDRARLG